MAKTLLRAKERGLTSCVGKFGSFVGSRLRSRVVLFVHTFAQFLSLLVSTHPLTLLTRSLFPPSPVIRPVYRGFVWHGDFVTFCLAAAAN